MPKKPATPPLMMAGIPVNRRYSYEKKFFKEGTSVLQGITFPLKKKSFKGGKIKLKADAANLGATHRSPDARDISYVKGDS